MRPSQLGHRLSYRARIPFFRSRAYARSLGASAPASLLRVPPALFDGDPAAGQRLLDGALRLINLEQPMRPPADWDAAGKPLLWRFLLHSFDWLDDLAALEQPAGAACARSLVADWMRRHAGFDEVAWHPYPLSLRIHAWLRNAPLLLANAEGAFQPHFLASLDRQARHLGRVLEKDVGGNHLIKNLKALIAAGTCLPGHEQRTREALVLLEQELQRQILPDGAHYERSPSYHVQVLCDLLETDALLRAAGAGQAASREALERMAAAYATYRHGDGLLALFNDGSVGERRLLESLDRVLGGAPRPREALEHAGYARLSAGGTLVLFDAGLCAPDDLPAHAHADTLSFELSSGGERLIVNCGTYAYQDEAWRQRLRGTAAHSTVTLAGADSAEVYAAFRLGRRPRRVTLHTARTPAGLAATGEHDGYRHLGVLHRRRLVLDEQGRLQGEDELLPLRASRLPFAVRFHLHPQVSPTLEEKGAALRLPGGRVWRFRCAAGRLAVEDSVYAPQFYRMEPTRQLVVRGQLAGETLVLAWTLGRDG